MDRGQQRSGQRKPPSGTRQQRRQPHQTQIQNPRATSEHEKNDSKENDARSEGNRRRGVAGEPKPARGFSGTDQKRSAPSREYRKAQLVEAVNQRVGSLGFVGSLVELEEVG